MSRCNHIDKLETYYESGDALQQHLVIECVDCGARATVDTTPHLEGGPESD